MCEESDGKRQAPWGSEHGRPGETHCVLGPQGDPRRSSWARYINHSVRRQNCDTISCGLSLLSSLLPPSREPFCVYIEASRDIAQGEELLMDYGRKYWDTQQAALGRLRRLRIDYL